MDPILVILAEGFEEIEAVTIIDVLRRADFSVHVAALKKSPVMGAHGISVVADVELAHRLDDWFSAVVLPGGMPGSTNLCEDLRVARILQRHRDASRIVAAICAAPMVLQAAGLLAGRRATAYPGTELPSATFVEDRVVVDGSIVTSRGPGTALEFSLTLVGLLGAPERAAQLRKGMMVVGSAQ